ncbi:MAG TPA: hypothetical protein VKQ54_16255 [Caulobacteraceae bacterium]|nr:hypothetical protein [Caulobacteraceae bacterium]
METMEINQHTKAEWARYGARFGFVPDPMILRAGEIFVNGSGGIGGLEGDSFAIWKALEQNIASIVEFFDMVATRDELPLIDYYMTFSRPEQPLEDLLEDRVCQVRVGWETYNRIKDGALVNLASLDLTGMSLDTMGMLSETNVFGYDWNPGLEPATGDAAAQSAGQKLAGVSWEARPIAQFLLGGLVFSGFAQASGAVHYVQPKRSRLYLGLTSKTQGLVSLGHDSEDKIFDDAAGVFQDPAIEVRRELRVPPVLPYLLERSPGRITPGDLLKRALDFPGTPVGRQYVAAVRAIRAGGIEGGQTTDMSAVERQAALDFLRPYSNLDANRSRSLDFKLKLAAGSIETAFKVKIPVALRLWYNENAPFVGMRKSLRRMWMSYESYTQMSRRLGEVWVTQ